MQKIIEKRFTFKVPEKHQLMIDEMIKLFTKQKWVLKEYLPYQVLVGICEQFDAPKIKEWLDGASLSENPFSAFMEDVAIARGTHIPPDDTFKRDKDGADYSTMLEKRKTYLNKP